MKPVAFAASTDCKLQNDNCKMTIAGRAHLLQFAFCNCHFAIVIVSCRILAAFRMRAAISKSSKHAVLLLGILTLISATFADPHDRVSSPARDQAIRFTAVDVFIDPGGKPLAAYQFELAAKGTGIILVGVEGGEHAAYGDAPYYDPKANLQNRIVIAAFNTGDDLPRHRTRVARVMVRVMGAEPAKYSAKLIVAASPDQKPLAASISVSEGAAQ
jgi:hypothetical protein